MGETTTPTEHPAPSFFHLKPEFSPTPTSRTASLVPDIVDDGIHQAPSALDPLGPLGVYPYPVSNVQDDDGNLIISCRPCGPRLFDLVAEYPMSDYGLTSWSLLERDEELFEIDDIRDEEKAMQALWNRWIFSERRCFDLLPTSAALCLQVIEKSVSLGPPQSSDRICGSFSAYHHKNRRVERHARMAIGTFSPLTHRYTNDNYCPCDHSYWPNTNTSQEMTSFR